ncbi:MAG TPA: transporter, partial [Marinobacter sp.]|nr:transporter [Marinobacter sp.]
PVITTHSVKEFGLKKGADVLAFVKATEVSL